MPRSYSSLLVVLIATHFRASYGLTECISNYSELEKSILEDKSNIEQLIDAFFPVNRQQSTVVDVTYFLQYCNPSRSDGTVQCDNDTTRNYTFRHSSTPIHGHTPPHRLRLLSLYIYATETRELSLNISAFCKNSKDEGSPELYLCSLPSEKINANTLALRLLNKATTWVS